MRIFTGISVPALRTTKHNSAWLLVFDVFCILHSLDWYRSGDTCRETYRKDVKRFKDKWLKLLPKERIMEIADDELEAVRERLYSAFCLDEKEENGDGG